MIVSAQNTGLYNALQNSFRETRWGRVPCPIAEDIMESSSFTALEKALLDRGIRDLKPFSGGASSVVLDAGENVVRICFGAPQARPETPEVLQVIDYGSAGRFWFEIVPKADTHSVIKQDVQAVVEALQRRGYSWDDAKTNNIGRYKGQLFVIDPEWIDQAGGQGSPTPPARNNVRSMTQWLPAFILELVCIFFRGGHLYGKREFVGYPSATCRICEDCAALQTQENKRRWFMRERKASIHPSN